MYCRKDEAGDTEQIQESIGMVILQHDMKE
jgi:hypothetical protein